MQDSKYLIHNLKALGTIWYIEVFNQGDIKSLQSVKTQIINTIRDFEQDYTRFDSSSKLMQLNIDRSYHNASQEFIELVQLGIKYYNTTQQVFNFAIADILTRNGYGPNSATQLQASSKDLNDNIKVNGNDIYLSGDITLDFGGFGKGYLIDKIALILKANGINEFLINGGGDILATSCSKQPIKIYLQDPINTNRYQFAVSIKDSAICSSSSYKRQWVYNGNKQSHIYDTIHEKSILNANSSVTAADCMTADMLATALCVRKDREYLNELNNSFNFQLINYL
jgi:thiamine biosynthesis lipoprotein